ncbi:MAG: response regulator [Candidatus Delongbacteria bacterium]|jgi:PAS domain S-box-containing protein|nr:response regulator [Candidatus Delongbacteria bacterium]
MLQLIKKRLLYKLFAIFFIAIILPLGISTLFVYDYIEDRYCENIESSLGWGENYVLANFSNELKLLKASLLKVENDSKLINLLTNDLENKDLIQISLYEVLADNNLDFIYVYDSNNNVLFQTGKFIQITDEFLAKKNTNPEISHFNSKFITHAKIDIKTDSKKSKNIAILFGKILSEHMLYDLSNIMELDFVILKKKNGRQINIYSTLFDDYGRNLGKGFIKVDNVDDSDPMDLIDILGEKYHSSFFSLISFDEKYNGMILAKENMLYLNKVKLYLFLFFFGSTFLVILSILFIRIKLIKPVTQLLKSIQEASEQIQNEHPIERIKVKTSDEIFLLSEAYNDMASNLGQSFSKVKYLQNYLLNIIESMPSSLIALDDEGKITQWNQAAVNFTGVARDQAKGKIIWELLPELGIDEDTLKSLHKEKNQKEYYKESIWSGEKRDLNVHLFPLVANGVQGNVIRIDDITDAKNKEQQLLQAQKMETIGTLAGGIAHDFNNILSGIVGAISILTYKLNKNEDFSKDLLREYLNIMEESGKRAGDIVQRLLTLSKKQSTNLEAVNLTEVIDHVENISLNSFDKRIEIKKINTKNNTFIFADFTQIEQLVLNLSINASHAMTIMRSEHEKQGGVLTFEINENVDTKEIGKLIDVPIGQEFIKLIVSDTGVGMDNDTIKQIYEPFFSNKDTEFGTGLGLTMAYNIANQFNGTIDVESTPNIGTIFSVYFPKFNSSSDINRIDDNLNLTKGSGTILVVDDELVLRELSVSMLTQCGYKVITACDGVEGLKLYQENHSQISAVILDMVMPKMNGKDTYIELKKINPNIKVLLASGFTRDDRVEEVIDLGVTDFIQKPYTIFELSDIIHKIINGDK